MSYEEEDALVEGDPEELETGLEEPLGLNPLEDPEDEVYDPDDRYH